MRLNLYRSNGQPVNEEDTLSSIEDLASYINDRYSLDSEAEVVDNSFSVLIHTGNAQDILFEAYDNGRYVECGCPGLKSYIKPSIEWANAIIEANSLSKSALKKDNGYPIIEAVCDSVVAEMEDVDNYDESSFMDTLRLPCSISDVDRTIMVAERSLDSLYSSITDKLEKMVKKILKERVERRTRRVF